MRRRSKPMWSVLDWRVTRTWAPGMHLASWSEEGVRLRRETATPGAVWAVAARAGPWPWLWVWVGAASAVALVVAARAAAANRVRVLRCMRNGAPVVGMVGPKDAGAGGSFLCVPTRTDHTGPRAGQGAPLATAAAWTAAATTRSSHAMPVLLNRRGRPPARRAGPRTSAASGTRASASSAPARAAR